MDAWIWIVLVLVVIAVIAYVVWRRMRTEQLRSRFGDEYERTVTETGKRSDAESELLTREKRRKELTIVPLSQESRERHAQSWRDTQTRFVDAPAEAVTDADRLVQEVMQERGYPVEDFEQRSSDISVDHPGVVQDYRAAHAISLANDHGQASTEDLRQAMVHYRSLFEVLLEDGIERTEQSG
jgi:hypothetical protein